MSDDLPEFCVEIINSGEELAVRSRCPLREKQQSKIREMIMGWVSHKHGDRHFDGIDLVEVAQVLKRAEQEMCRKWKDESLLWKFEAGAEHINRKIGEDGVKEIWLKAGFATMIVQVTISMMKGAP